MNRKKVLEEFGSRVRTQRVSKNLSQEALAHKCQLDRTYISGIERGMRNPSLTGILKIARGLGIDPGILLMHMRSR